MRPEPSMSAGPDRMQWLLLVPPEHKRQQFNHKNLWQCFIRIYSTQVFFFAQRSFHEIISLQDGRPFACILQSKLGQQDKCRAGWWHRKSCTMMSVQDFGNGEGLARKVKKIILTAGMESKGLL